MRRKLRRKLRRVSFSLGDVYAALGDSILSEIIAYLTHGQVSHVGLLTRKTCNELNCANPEHWEVTQALADGVVTITLAESLKTAKAAYILHNPNLDDTTRQKIVDYALKQVGIKYADTDLFWQLLDRLTDSTKFTNFLDDDTRRICSMLDAYAYLAGGQDFSISPRDCKPEDCFNYALKNAWNVWPAVINAGVA